MPRVAPPDARPPLSGAPGRTPAKPPRPLEERARARPERPRSDRPTHWQLMRRRHRRLLRPAAVGLVVLLTVGGVAVLARGAQPGLAIAGLRERVAAAANLRVDQVRIEGRILTPEPLLRAALGVAVGDKLLGFSLEAARARIEKLTWVQHATVERHLPGTVVVQLTERRPFAVWQNAGKFVLIDRAGQVVAEQDPVKDAAAFTVLPLVVGAGAPENAAALLDQLAAQPGLKSRVVAAIRVGERRWNLRLNNGADVLLPEGQEAVAMAKLMELQGTQALLDRPLQTLDLRLPDRLVVRPQAEPHGPVPSGPRRPT
jgi:cell division protein FtsQ